MIDDQLAQREIQRGPVRFQVLVNRNDQYLQDSWSAYETSQWEPWSFAMLDQYVTPQTIFLDVGAWLGAMSLHVANRANRVIAFEADPIAYQCVSQNIRANPEFTHVEAVNGFVSDSNGTQRISSLHHGNNSGTTGLLDLGGDSWEVPRIDFAKIISDLPPDAPLFVKMDIEGAEYQVLRCYGDLLSRRKKTILMLSMHPTILAQTIKGRGFVARCRRRARLVSAHNAIFRRLGGFRRIIGQDQKQVSMRSLLSELFKTGSLVENHRDLLFIND